MSTKPVIPPPDVAGAEVDDLLEAWFRALMARPVPEALIETLDRLDEGGATSD